jgi:hypothetical protein
MPAGTTARQRGGLRQFEDLFGEPGLADTGAASEQDAADRIVTEPVGQRLELVPRPTIGQAGARAIGVGGPAVALVVADVVEPAATSRTGAAKR